MATAYIVTNKSGNRVGVTEKRFNQIKGKDGYTLKTVEIGESKPIEDKGVPYKGKSSTDYTIAELTGMRDDFHEDQWNNFVKDDKRKSVPE